MSGRQAPGETLSSGADSGLSMFIRKNVPARARALQQQTGIIEDIFKHAFRTIQPGL